MRSRPPHPLKLESPSCGVPLVPAMFALLGVVFTASPSRAHGNLHERIDALTWRIAASPSDPVLLLERCDLLCVHGDFAAAGADLDAVEKLAPAMPRLALRRGEIAAARGEWAPACAAFDRAVVEEPAGVVPRLRRARAREALGRHAAAIDDFSFAIAHLTDPRPENFLDRATAQERAGDLAAAIAGLDEGIARLGPLPALHLRALALERRLGRPLDGLRRVRELAAHSERREQWLALEGELLGEAGRAGEARASFVVALREIDALPRDTIERDDVQTLRTDITRRLAALK